ncbi:MAG: hypothetical protein J5767_12640 [Paludibacteraceae bacterium]|nr:hypothetical protein [Paludibacteraceae bacterium]
MNIEKTKQYLKIRQQNLLNGGCNCISSPFDRFLEDFPGLMMGDGIVVTAATKGAKSQFTNFLVKFNSLRFAMENPDKCHLHIMDFLLEESEKDLNSRYFRFLYYLIDGDLVGKHKLESTREPVSDELLNRLDTPRYMKFEKFYSEHIEVHNVTNPRKIIDKCWKFVKNNADIRFKDDDKLYTGNELSDSYYDMIAEHSEIEETIWHDPMMYFIINIDHISLISEFPNKNLKQSIDELSKVLMINFRRDMKCIVSFVQQQNFDQESNESVKRTKGMPTKSNLADSKYPSRDTVYMFGVYSPASNNINEYGGYDIERLKDNVRFVTMMVNRNGTPGSILPLGFLGQAGWFEELPKPDDPEMESRYTFEWYLNRKKRLRDELMNERERQNREYEQRSLFDEDGNATVSLETAFLLNFNREEKCLTKNKKSFWPCSIIRCGMIWLRTAISTSMASLRKRLMSCRREGM